MIFSLKRIFALLILIFGTFAANAQAKNLDESNIPAQIAIQVLNPPQPLFALNKNYLVYELHLTNYQPVDAILTSLDVLADHGQKFHYDLSDPSTHNIIQTVGEASTSNNDTIKNKKVKSNIISSGATKIIFIWLEFDQDTKIPSQLRHQLKIQTQKDEKLLELETTTLPTTVNFEPIVTLDPPLKGGYWAAMGGPSNNSYHRRSNTVIHGVDYFAQRYAIDFVKIGENGKTYHDDPTKNENYYCYNQDIIAARDGVVTSIQDGIPENIPLSGKMAVPINLKTVGGNYIVIEIANDEYLFYAHMIPGSLKVKPGDRVKAGQVIGKLGNSGHSTEPHLHFHVVDNPSFLGANGIPYAFKAFTLYPSQLIHDDPNYEIKIINTPPKTFNNQLMLENCVVAFEGEE